MRLSRPSLRQALNTVAPPRIVNSSFTIRPPATDASNANWCFARLQFRRVLANTAADALPSDAKVSNWTDPVWAQFLPDFSLFDSSTDVVSVDQLKMGQRAGLTFALMKDGVTVEFTPLEFTPLKKFELWCVLTRMVSDVFTGSMAATQESFVDIAKYDPAQKTFTLSRDPGGSDFRLRLIEVQRREDGSGNLLDDLFPDTTTEDAPVRIVRVSRHFASQ